jgi:hypothetical protein
MTYDAEHGGIVLFGGATMTTGYGDTWQWNGTAWDLLSTNSPAARSQAVMVDDLARQELVLFGGTNESSTWAWDGTTWSQLAVPLAPEWRVTAAIAYDAARGRAVMFGGRGASGGLGDTWTF